MKEIFGELADVLAKENENDCAESVTAERIRSNLPYIRTLIAALPTPEQMTKQLEACGACRTLEDIGLSSDELLPALYRRAPLIRNRLTLMRLLRCFEI